MRVDVNGLSDAELRSQLALVPKLPCTTAAVMMRLRPFVDANDFVRRVNLEVPLPRDRVGAKLRQRFSVDPVRARSPCSLQPSPEVLQPLISLDLLLEYATCVGLRSHISCALYRKFTLLAIMGLRRNLPLVADHHLGRTSMHSLESMRESCVCFSRACGPHSLLRRCHAPSEHNM